jgi:hypothetical protein
MIGYGSKQAVGIYNQENVGDITYVKQYTNVYILIIGAVVVVIVW